ncbi:MAG TPA: hypothetical protein VHU40_11160 [Polyangia bacterium]|jgi:hypothetical protein|nr:hypothetical protein [Polyangia bacterium]
MANTKKKQSNEWRGDEVERRPDAEAERDADRAEGNGAVSAAEALRPEAPDRPAHARQPSERPDQSDQKTAEAAEAHRERRDSGDGAPRRNTL